MADEYVTGLNTKLACMTRSRAGSARAHKAAVTRTATPPAISNTRISLPAFRVLWR
jgi:hypothetical protein